MSLLATDIHEAYNNSDKNIWIKYFYHFFNINAIIKEPYLIQSIKRDMLYNILFNNKDRYSNAIGSTCAYEIKFTDNDISTIFKSYIHNDVYKLTGIDYITFASLSQADMDVILTEISAYNTRKVDKMNALNNLEDL